MHGFYANTIPFSIRDLSLWILVSNGDLESISLLCMWFTNIFFDLVGCLFILMMVSFTVQKHFSLIQGLQLFSGFSCLLDSMASKALQGLTTIFNHSTCIFPLILHREAMELAVPWMCPAVSLTSEPLHMLYSFATLNHTHMYLCMHAKSLQLCLTLWDPTGLLPARFLYSLDSPGKNTGVGCHALLQGIFPSQGSNPCLVCLLHWQVGYQ